MVGKWSAETLQQARDRRAATKAARMAQAPTWACWLAHHSPHWVTRAEALGEGKGQVPDWRAARAKYDKRALARLNAERAEQAEDRHNHALAIAEARRIERKG